MAAKVSHSSSLLTSRLGFCLSVYLGPLNGDDALQGASNKDQQILCAYSPWQSWGSCFSESGNTGSGAT